MPEKVSERNTRPINLNATLMAKPVLRGVTCRPKKTSTMTQRFSKGLQTTPTGWRSKREKKIQLKELI